MTEKKFVVVVYDISDNKRRTKLHNRLKDFGYPVQYSVFECLLDDERLQRMQAAVSKITKPKIDHVRYYRLCGACQKKIQVVGRHEVTSEPDVLVV